MQKHLQVCFVFFFYNITPKPKCIRCHNKIISRTHNAFPLTKTDFRWVPLAHFIAIRWVAANTAIIWTTNGALLLLATLLPLLHIHRRRSAACICTQYTPCDGTVLLESITQWVRMKIIYILFGMLYVWVSNWLYAPSILFYMNSVAGKPSYEHVGYSFSGFICSICKSK